MVKIVSYSDIHRAIVSKLKSKFEDITITSTDVKEGFERPSFFITFDNVKTKDFMNVSADRELTVRIHYFSKDKDKNKLELLDMQGNLTDLFLQENTIAIDEYTTVIIDEIEFDTVDGVMVCFFDINLSEDYDRSDDNVETMDDIQVKFE